MKLLWCWALYGLFSACNGASLANRVERSAADLSSSLPDAASNTTDTTTSTSGTATSNTDGQRLKKRSVRHYNGAISLNCRTIVMTGITDAGICSRVTGRQVAHHFRMRTRGQRTVREVDEWYLPKDLWNEESDDFWNESDDWWNDHSESSFKMVESEVDPLPETPDPETTTPTTPASTTSTTTPTTPTTTTTTTASTGATGAQGGNFFQDPYYYRDTLPGNCRYDLNRAALDPSTACLCAATPETCTLGRSGCFWNKDKKTGLNECVSNAERFYVRLAQLLKKRGKKNFAINIKYGATGARGELPLGPWGPAVIGYGNPSPSKTIGLFKKHKHQPKHHFNYPPLPGEMGGMGPRHRQPQSHKFMERTSPVLNSNNSATSHNLENMFENDRSNHRSNVGDMTNPRYQGQMSSHERRGRIEAGSAHMSNGGMQGLGGRGGFRDRSTIGFGTYAGEGGGRVTGMNGGMGSSMPMVGSGMRGPGTSITPDMTGSNRGEFSTPLDSGMTSGMTMDGGMGGPGMTMDGGMRGPGMAGAGMTMDGGMRGPGMAGPGMGMAGGMAGPGMAGPGMAMSGNMAAPGMGAPRMTMGGGMGGLGMALSGGMGGGMTGPGMAMGGGMTGSGMAGPGMAGPGMAMGGNMAAPGMGAPGMTMGSGMGGPSMALSGGMGGGMGSGMGGPGMALSGGMGGPGMALGGGMGGPGMAMG